MRKWMIFSLAGAMFSVSSSGAFAGCVGTYLSQEQPDNDILMATLSVGLFLMLYLQPQRLFKKPAPSQVEA